MKTSNKIFAAALLLLFCSLTAYKMAFRAERCTGNYKNPLHNYHPLALNNFDAVSVPSVSGL